MDTTTSFALKYVRKPLIVEAVHITEANFGEAARWCTGEVYNVDGTERDKAAPLDPKNQYIQVRVSNPRTPDQTKAKIGDWILYSDRGYKVYKARAFESSFDPLGDEEIVPDHVDEDDNGSTQVELLDDTSEEVRRRLANG